jgi:hypothetical protein
MSSKLKIMKPAFIKKTVLQIIVFSSASMLFHFCRKNDVGTELPQQKENASSKFSERLQTSQKIYVGNVEELYAAINKEENAGVTLVLAPATYMLNANYPKVGRLELQHNMSLQGQPGNPGAVIIDATQLPLGSFTIAPTTSRTGAIRMGNGANSLEWITFQNDPAHTIRSLIQTDIVTTSSTQIRVAHCVIKGSSIGLSLLNRDPVSNGRMLEAEVEDNEIFDNTILQFGSAIQIQNTTVNDAVIKVNLSRNYIYGNRAGMLIFNSSSQRCSVEVKSNNDRIENNGLGILLNGGFITSASSPALDNTLSFESFATSIKNNSGTPAPPFAFPAAGVHAAAGQSMPPFDPPGTSHNNSLKASFSGSQIENNAGNFEINAYGGHSGHPSSIPVGSYNTAEIYLNGLSKKATVNAINSFPTELQGTNTVMVYK